MIWIALGAAALSFVIAGCHFWSVYGDMRSRLPPHLQDEAMAGMVVRGLVWEPGFPATVRRRYFVSLIATCTLTMSLSLAALLHGEKLAALLLAGASVLALAHTMGRWRRHGRQL